MPSDKKRKKEVNMRGHQRWTRVFLVFIILWGLPIFQTLAQDELEPITVDENGNPITEEQANEIVEENLQVLENTSETITQDLLDPLTAEEARVAEAQVISSVLGTIYSNPQLTMFTSLLEASTLPELLAGEGSYTVFAPTNAALAALPDGTLESLALPVQTLGMITTADTLDGQKLTFSFDQGLRVNKTPLVAVDILATNGTVHTIAGLLTLPMSQNAPVQTNTATLDIILASDPDYSLFVSLLKQTGLLSTLSTDNSFTVFVPSNEALAALPEETLAQLQNSDRLLEILAYHVSLQEVSSFQLGTLTTLPTMFGEVTLGKELGKTTINGLNLVGDEVQGSNGVIHRIDGLLLPTQTLVQQGNQ
jgi:transforming growth factor-beta-induced protein